MDRRAVILGISATASGIGRANAANLETVLDAKPFAQTKGNSCWVAAAVILLRWKNKIDVLELDVATMAGPKFVTKFKNDAGLNGTDFSEFAAALHMRTEAPQNFTPTGYHNLLKAHGPLWVGSRLDKETTNTRRHIESCGA